MKFSLFNKKDKQEEAFSETKADMNSGTTTKNGNDDILAIENVRLGQKSVTVDEAIEMAGQILVDGGYIMPEYIEAMKEREKIVTTYIGNGIAIPHGVGAAKDKIIKSGISILQFPEGIAFSEANTAYLVIGIAGKDNEHMKILTNLAEFIQDEEFIKKFFTTTDKEHLYKMFTNKL